jgi:hypothetical protein
MIKLKNNYGENYVNVLKKHFGFFPFDVINQNNRKFITKKDFIYADHPIRITTTPEKWSSGIISYEIMSVNKNNWYNSGPPSWFPNKKREPHPLFVAIWNTMNYKGITTEKMYNRIILNLNNIFYIKNSEFIVLNQKYHQHFVPAISAFNAYKNIST